MIKDELHHAPVAQWIEQPPSKRSVGRSSRLGRDDKTYRRIEQKRKGSLAQW